jgi:hypothetical protein
MSALATFEWIASLHSRRKSFLVYCANLRSSRKYLWNLMRINVTSDTF